MFEVLREGTEMPKERKECAGNGRHRRGLWEGVHSLSVALRTGESLALEWLSWAVPEVKWHWHFTEEGGCIFGELCLLAFPTHVHSQQSISKDQKQTFQWTEGFSMFEGLEIPLAFHRRENCSSSGNRSTSECFPPECPAILSYLLFHLLLGLGLCKDSFLGASSGHSVTRKALTSTSLHEMLLSSLLILLKHLGTGSSCWEAKAQVPRKTLPCVPTTFPSVLPCGLPGQPCVPHHDCCLASSYLCWLECLLEFSPAEQNFTEIQNLLQLHSPEGHSLRDSSVISSLPQADSADWLGMIREVEGQAVVSLSSAFHKKFAHVT